MTATIPTQRPNPVVRMTLFGVAFGSMFPLVATLMDLWLQGQPFTLGGLWAVQAAQPLHWVIDTAPLVLGVVFGLVGRRQAEISALQVEHLGDSETQRAAIFDAVVNGGSALAEDGRIEDVNPAAEAGAEATGRRLRVLLAEDNHVNQMVTVALLTKKGHSVDVAGTGREAVEQLEAGEYDVVLMDVQMPEMDGLEATRLIRESEEGTPTHIPIIATTAHARKGDRERCLDAGMDDYLAKPIAPKELEAALERVGGDASHDCPPVFDYETAFLMVGEDDDLLRALAELFVNQSQSRVDAILDAVATGDSEAMQRAGHSLKGTASTMGMGRLSEIACDLEERGRDGRAAESREVAMALVEAMAETLRTLRSSVLRD